MNAAPAEFPDSGERPPLGRRVAEVAAVFVRLGFTAFGGPAAHVAMMEEEVVTRRKWLDRRQFLDAFAAINFIPGPGSTELAIYLGWFRAGLLGLLTAGFCFIVPAVLIILPIAWAYVRYGQITPVRGMMGGVNAAVVAIIAAACLRFARTAIRNSFEMSIASGAMIAAALLVRFPVRHLQPDLCILAAAALAGAMRRTMRRKIFSAAFVPLIAAPLPSAAGMGIAPPAAGGFLQLSGLFLKIGATLFGSGYVLVSYLQNSVVDQYHWMNKEQLLNAISVGQFTPGPLLTSATFIGYIRGWQISRTVCGAVCGAIIATASIFAPAFALIAIGAGFLQRLRKNALAAAALDAINAAVVALIAVAALRLGAGVLHAAAGRGAVVAFFIFSISIIALLKYNLNATWLILLGAIAGLASSLHQTPR